LNKKLLTGLAIWVAVIVMAKIATANPLTVNSINRGVRTEGTATFTEYYEPYSWDYSIVSNATGDFNETVRDEGAIGSGAIQSSSIDYTKTNLLAIFYGRNIDGAAYWLESGHVNATSWLTINFTLVEDANFDLFYKAEGWDVYGPIYTISLTNKSTGIIDFFNDPYAALGINVFKKLTAGNYVFTEEVFGSYSGSGHHYTVMDSSLTISSIPEPATMLLFGTGIAGLAAVGRRKRN